MSEKVLLQHINKEPLLHKDAFIDRLAAVLGNVTIGAFTGVWPMAVIRGDMNLIKIGSYSNIQDNVTVHNDIESPCIIGDYVTVGHNAVLHGCTIQNCVIVGMGAIVLNNVVIGENSIIGAGALVTSGKVFPPGSLIMGSPAKAVRVLNEDEIKKIKDNADAYVELLKSKKGVK